MIVARRLSDLFEMKYDDIAELPCGCLARCVGWSHDAGGCLRELTLFVLHRGCGLHEPYDFVLIPFDPLAVELEQNFG